MFHKPIIEGHYGGTTNDHCINTCVNSPLKCRQLLCWENIRQGSIWSGAVFAEHWASTHPVT